MIHRLLDGLGVHLNQVDVFRIAWLWLQIEFVQRRAASEGKMLLQEGIAEYRHQCPADN